MKKILPAAAAVAAAMIVFFIYLKLTGGRQEQLSLWYAEEPVPSSAMEELAVRYSSQHGGEDCRLVLRSFSSEAELATAFESERPDLLLCSYTRAASLGSRGLLDSVELADSDYLPAIEEALPFAGRSFFPLGSQSPILVYNTAMLEEAGISPEFDSFEDFMEKAGEYKNKKHLPFFSAESLLPLLSSCCGSLGYRIVGELKKDGLSEDFSAIYNSLALAALDGSFLPPGEDRLDLASAGLLPLVVLDAPRTGSLPEGLSYAPLPLPQGGRQVYVPDILGFAVTGANSYALPQARDFALWLRDSFSQKDILAMGLIPATSLSETEASSELEGILVESWQEAEALLYPPLSDFTENRRDMEEALCHALDLLY